MRLSLQSKILKKMEINKKIKSDLQCTVVKTPPHSWDDTVNGSTSRSLLMYHSTDWAKRIDNVFGYSPIYFLVYNSNNLVLAIQAFEYKYEKIHFKEFSLKLSCKNILKNFISLTTKKSSMLWYGEPIICDQNVGLTEYVELSNKIKEYEAKSGCKLIYGSWPLVQEVSVAPNFKVKKWATFIIDLKCGNHELWKRLKASARKEIIKASKRGITIKQIDNVNELERYYEFARQCAKRYKKDMFGFDDYKSMWNDLRKNWVFETFVAYHNEKMIAGLSIWGGLELVGELGSFQSEFSFQNKLGGADAVKWAAIEWARNNGIIGFDLSGVSPAPSDKKEINIKSFKAKWGGEEEQFLILKSYK